MRGAVAKVWEDVVSMSLHGSKEAPGTRSAASFVTVGTCHRPRVFRPLFRGECLLCICFTQTFRERAPGVLAAAARAPRCRGLGTRSEVQTPGRTGVCRRAPGPGDTVLPGGGPSPPVCLCPS